MTEKHKQTYTNKNYNRFFRKLLWLINYSENLVFNFLVLKCPFSFCVFRAVASQSWALGLELGAPQFVMQEKISYSFFMFMMSAILWLRLHLQLYLQLNKHSWICVEQSRSFETDLKLFPFQLKDIFTKLEKYQSLLIRFGKRLSWKKIRSKIRKRLWRWNWKIYNETSLLYYDSYFYIHL